MAGFNSIEDAAAAALVEAMARSEQRSQNEHIGAVFERDGNFFFTEPASLHGRTGGSTRLQVPQGSLRALFHNHPSGRGNDWFSPEDIQMAEQLGVPSFIAIAGEGAPDLRVFRPGETETRTKAGSQGQFSRGDQFLAPIPIDQIRKRMMVDILQRAPDDPRGLRRGLLESAPSQLAMGLLSQRRQ